MIIYPAIDIYQGRVVRLEKGDYEKMTVYSDDPCSVLDRFIEKGAKYVHVVDLEGAKNGGTPNFEIIEKMAQRDIYIQVGGGIRNMEVLRKYLDAGINRVIIGTAAVKNPNFLREAVNEYGDRIAVAADFKNGVAAIEGWIKESDLTVEEFFKYMEEIGVSSVICTDISKDGMLEGINLGFYREICNKYSMDITASGGVSSIDDIIKLKETGVVSAITGKACYVGNIDLGDALEAAK